MRMNSFSWTSALLIPACFVIFSPVNAGEVKGSGSATYVPVASDISQLPDGTTLQRVHLKGIVLADNESNPLHLTGQDCFGTVILDADGNLLNGKGYCDAINEDGEMWWLWWNNSPKERNWGFLGGTGKYEGIRGGGTTEIEVLLPDGRQTIRWEGKWEMK